MTRYRKPRKVRGWNFSQIKFSSEGPRINYSKIVESYLNKNQKLLDIGTGGGEKFLKFAPKVKEAIGIDVDPKMIKTARENLRKSGLSNVKFEVCDSEKLKFGDQEFDVVIDRQAPFNPKEVARVLKPGGVFITQQVGEGDKLNFKEIFQRGDSYGIKPGTLKNRYLRELQKAGMKIIEEKTANTIEYYQSMSDVVFLLANTPIVPDFNFEREQDKLKQIEERFTTEKGIKTNAERFLIVAKKPEKNLPKNPHILYSGDEAEFLSRLQELWEPDEDEKAKVILEHLGGVESLLDLGCGPGQLLKRLAGKVSRLVGVDESEEMLENAARNCPSAELVRTKAEDMKFREEFDVVVTSQMLHEVKQFGTAGQMDVVLRVVWDALKPGGRYFLLDHIDPGEGKVTVRLRQDDALLREFVRKFRYRHAQLRKLGPSLYEMEKRDLQDFVTKTWALRSPMEEMEMEETHAAFDEEEAKEIVRGAGFSPGRFITLTNMGRDLEDHGMELRGEPPWDRKFLLISSKPK